MPAHTLEAGKQIIEGLFRLGEALGYSVAKELPVEKGKKYPAAVDVAWLSEEGQEFPLMIFEVESKVTNAIANNPTKVFAKPNQSFEKPLFFFHVMVTGGKETSRVEDLRRLFGTHNYRAYELAGGKTAELVKDIFSQHRRLTNKLDLINVINVLQSDPWDTLNLLEILQHIETIGFERGAGTFLPRYAALSKADIRFHEHFIRYLSARELAQPYVVEYDAYSDSFIGQFWATPINLGLLLLSTDDQDKKRFFFEKLIDWQEKSSYLSQIGPHLHLSRDYTMSIVGVAASYWGLIAILMHDLPEAVKYIANQCRALLAALESWASEYSFFTALWLLHISASSESALDCYEYARSFINDRGGISEELLYQPVGFIDIEEFAKGYDPNWLAIANSSPLPVLSAEDFKNALAIRRLSSNFPHSEIISLALDSLLDFNAPSEWSPKLVHFLQR